LKCCSVCVALALLYIPFDGVPGSPFSGLQHDDSRHVTSHPLHARFLLSLPARRSSVLTSPPSSRSGRLASSPRSAGSPRSTAAADRKSTRLNSSHVKSSYALFSLRKKEMLLSVTGSCPNVYSLQRSSATSLVRTAKQ